MMVDLLATGDCEFGVQVFDELQRGQKLGFFAQPPKKSIRAKGRIRFMDGFRENSRKRESYRATDASSEPHRSCVRKQTMPTA